MRAIIRFWASLGFALTLFGIFWLPKDIQDWKDAAQPWKRALAMVDQNTALWVFSIVLLLYLVTIELLPRAITYFQDKNINILLEDIVIDISESKFYEKMAFPFSIKNMGRKNVEDFSLLLERVEFPSRGHNEGRNVDKYLKPRTNHSGHLRPREFLVYNNIMLVDDKSFPLKICNTTDGVDFVIGEVEDINFIIRPVSRGRFVGKCTLSLKTGHDGKTLTVKAWPTNLREQGLMMIRRNIQPKKYKDL